MSLLHCTLVELHSVETFSVVIIAGIDANCC